MTNHILKIENLSIGYISKKKKIVVAKEINIQQEKGKLVCLLGKNGIGKSTLLRTISKMQVKLKGDVFIHNQEIESYTALELSKLISTVLTEKIPPNNLTVYELIALGRQPYTNWIGTLTQEDKQQIDNAISQANLNEIKTKRIDELSDGQYQKVMIARALAQNTPIILFDEPTAHLDIHHKIETFKMLQQLTHKLDKTIIISTHEVQLAIQKADMLWLFLDDKLIYGNTNTLIENGNLQELFSSDLVAFDKELKQFVFH